MISDVCEPCNPGGDNQIDLQALTFLKVVTLALHTSFEPGRCGCRACSTDTLRKAFERPLVTH